MEGTMPELDYRPLTDSEKAIVMKMLSVDLPGVEILREQANHAMARVLDRYGSIAFKLGLVERTRFSDGPLISALQPDTDTVQRYGPYVNIILFIKDGLIAELQIYKDDGSKILGSVDVQKFDLVVDKRKA
jgi:hypothetical protein